MINVKNLSVVKVHCGSAHVRGAAKNYRYYVASLFKIRKTKDGRLIFVNSGKTTHPRRSINLCKEDGLELAEKYGAAFMGGYGSLHNQDATENEDIVNLMFDNLVRKLLRSNKKEVLMSIFE